MLSSEQHQQASLYRTALQLPATALRKSVSDAPTPAELVVPLLPLPQAVGCSTMSSAHHFNSSRLRIAGGVARTRAALSTPTAVPRPLDRPLDSPTVSAAAAASASAAERRASSWYLRAVQCAVYTVSVGAVCVARLVRDLMCASVIDYGDSSKLKRSTKLCAQTQYEAVPSLKHSVRQACTALSRA
jgi:hypothetical protein